MGQEPFCGLVDVFFKDELKKLITTRREALEGKRQATELLAGWNLKRFRACIGLSLIRPKILVGCITEGIAITLEKSESDRKMYHADFTEEERKHFYTCLADAMSKRSNSYNLGKHHILGWKKSQTWR